MPVEARYLDDLVTALLVIAAQYLDRDDGEIDHADRHVRAVETRDHEEERAELRRTERVAPRTNAFLDDELRPLEGLHTDEDRAESGRHEHERRRFRAIAPVAHVHGERHRAAAGD